MRLGEVLGMTIGDFVMGLGGTAYIEVVPREGNANGARVKMMRPRRVHVGADLERLFADYLTHLACRAASLGLEITPDSPLLVNLDRPPLLAAMREGTVRHGQRAPGRPAVPQPRQEPGDGRDPGFRPLPRLVALLEERPPLRQRRRIPADRVR